MKEQNTLPPTKVSGNRPGQRQQERLRRLDRRRRRLWRIISVIVAILIVVLTGLGFWRYQQYRDDLANTANQHATATANVLGTHATATVQAITSKPAADTPPVVNTKPVTLPDGLQYIDITQGTGLPAASGNTVVVVYTGWVQSTGKKFDSTYDDGRQPFSVTLGQQQVIPGWDEGLVGVKVGGTRRLIIPPALAYGAQGQGPIPPNATLIFDVTVVGIQ